MIECPVCRARNVEDTKNCKKCGFDLKYVNGYHIDISDDELEKYKRELEEAKKRYKPTIEIPKKDMFEKTKEYIERLQKSDIEVGIATLKEYDADKEIFKLEYKLFPPGKGITILDYKEQGVGSIKISPQDAKNLYEESLTHPLYAKISFVEQGHIIETMRIGKFVLDNTIARVIPERRVCDVDYGILVDFFSLLNRKYKTNYPTNIKDIKNLRELDLSEKKLRGVPKELGFLFELETLDLRNNRLETIPEEIGNLYNLRRLYLYGNKLKTIPKEIGNLYNLEELSLSDNQLETLPKELGNLYNLKKLYLWWNNIKSLPKEVWDLRKMGCEISK